MELIQTIFIALALVFVFAFWVGALFIYFKSKEK